MRAIDGDALRDRLQNLADDEWNRSTPTSWAEAFTECADMVEDAPTIEPEPHWIPCSERLPEKNGFYLCTTKDCITILEFIEGNLHYHEEPSFVSDVLGKCNPYVVAWMPLPESYRAGRRI